MRRKNIVEEKYSKKSEKFNFDLNKLKKDITEEIFNDFFDEFWEGEKNNFSNKDSKMILNFLSDDLGYIGKVGNQKVYGCYDYYGIIVNSNNRIIGKFICEDYGRVIWQLEREKLGIVF